MDALIRPAFAAAITLLALIAAGCGDSGGTIKPEASTKSPIATGAAKETK